MKAERPRARYPALGFALSAAFVVFLGWTLYDGVIRPSMQPAVDYVQTGLIR